MVQPTAPRHKLRNYLIALFVPLTGLPLVILAVLTYFLVGRATDQEIRRRARPEIATLARNLETVEKRFFRDVLLLAQNRTFHANLRAKSVDVLEEQTKPWFQASLFDQVKVYSADGRLILEIRQPESKKWDEAWHEALGVARDPSSLKSDSTPAPGQRTFFNPRSRFESGNRDQLRPSFRNFLLRDDSWSVRDFDGERGSARIVLFKAIPKGRGRTGGFIEAIVKLDSPKLEILARDQGIELILMNRDYKLLGTSSRAVEKQVKSFTDLPPGKTSIETSISGEPVEFFFSSLQSGNGSLLFGLGLKKSEQVALQKEIILWISVMATLLALGVVFFTVYLSGRITQPISNLVNAVEGIKQGIWVEPVEADSTNEIGYLVKRFNDMAQSVQVTKRTLELKLEELAQAQDQLVHSAKMSSLGQLVAGVAHELNNPIAFIYSNMSQMKGYLKNMERLNSLLRTISVQLDAKSKAQFERELEAIEWEHFRTDLKDITQSCLEGSIRVKDIVLGLRNFSRLDRGQITECEVNELVENTLKLLTSQIKNRVDVHLNLGTENRVRCNASQISQVFMNILANALQAIPAKGSIWVDIEKAIEANSEKVVIRIRDDGKGIPSENLAKIFDPFFTTKKVGEGTGLGLSIVYGIVQRHGGTIQVKSILAPSPDCGTEFTITLPRDGQRLEERLENAS